MKPSYYRDKFIALQKNAFDRNALSQLARQIANSFMDHYYQDSRYDEGYIDLMCQMATSFADKELSKVVSAAFFSVIIEELCDDYEDFRFEAYNRVMSQVVSYCRNVPAGKKLDQYLNRFNLFSADDLFNRAACIHTQDYHFNAEAKAIKWIYLLSRITIGADVAILSVMVQRLSNLFPDAKIIILGNLNLREIFGGNPCIQIQEVAYTRGGGLLERIESWCSAVDLLEREAAASRAGEVLVIDSDSRITQLGVLPIISDENCLYFNSHKDSSSSENACMAEHANAWMDQVFGCGEFCYPKVWPAPALLNRAETIINSLLQSGCQRITAVNFGVGGNPRKRLGSGFEKKLICELLKQSKTVVILDRGFGAEELAGSQEIADEVKSRGYAVCHAEFKQGKIENFSHGLLTVEGSIGQISALIGGSDEFIGYDSACQHIAAAMAVPTTTIFAGSNNPRFVRRWSACGNTSCRIIHVDTLGHPEDVNTDEILSRLMEERSLRPRKAAPALKIVDCKNGHCQNVNHNDTLKSRTL